MLARKVARLMSGENHQGSAWLICEEYALTALHCVQSDDGIFRPQISLIFHGQSIQIEADVFATDERIDVALLRLKHPVSNISDLVIRLSRSEVAQSNELVLHGHPAISATASPGGTSVFCIVIDPAAPYKGTKGNLDLNTVSMYSESTTPALAAGNSTSGLKGASGGVVARRIIGDSDSAVGLLIEDSLGGNALHAVPIAEIAKRFPQVQSALDRSSHVDLQFPRILLRVAESGHIQWSGTLAPSQVSQLWDLDPTKQGQLRISIAAKLRELGETGNALLRLSAYANLKSLRVPDRDSWTRGLKKLEDLHREPDTPIKYDDSTNVESCPAAWTEFESASLANLIHQALDSKLLAWLSDELYDCLENGKPINIGEKIEDNLRSAMWTHWKTWETVLRSNSSLLQHFLSRVFELDAGATVSEANFVSIGFCTKVRQQLLDATLFALALDASGVSTTPTTRDIGNLNVAKYAGHACGIVRRDQRDLRRFANSIDWKSDVVFLPYLQSSLLQLCEKSVPMTRTEGTGDHSLSQILPVALTAEEAFLDALVAGAQGVCDFYNKQVTDRETRLAALKLSGRTEVLDA